MSEPTKPRLTSSVARGLSFVYAHALADAESWSNDPEPGFASKQAEKDAWAAIEYVGKLDQWYKRTHRSEIANYNKRSK